MKYEVELTPAVDEQLTRLSAAKGETVAEVIRCAVIAFVDQRVRVAPARRAPGPIIDTPEISAPFDLPRRGPFKTIAPIMMPPRTRRPSPYLETE